MILQEKNKKNSKQGLILEKKNFRKIKIAGKVRRGSARLGLGVIPHGRGCKGGVKSEIRLLWARITKRNACNRANI